MINYKSIKWCLGMAALSVGLSSCNMMGFHNSESVDTHYQGTMQVHPQPQNKIAAPIKQHKAVQKTYASKDPTQQATPGPVRKAAPQLPVIE